MTTISGKLRHVVSIYEPVKSRTGSGSQQIVYTFLANRWGAVDFRSGAAEDELSGVQVGARRKYRIVIRYDSSLEGLETDWELIIEQRKFRVISVENVGLRNQWLVMVGVEVRDE